MGGEGVGSGGSRGFVRKKWGDIPRMRGSPLPPGDEQGSHVPNLKI